MYLKYRGPESLYQNQAEVELARVFGTAQFRCRLQTMTFRASIVCSRTFRSKINGKCEIRIIFRGKTRCKLITGNLLAA